eukprot:TRINITY_DN6570_c0_g1_i1.p1 TRINITY_DN6570_c0_g1~~TRINITY_DN6570_c0_g1_i1.p1  ORF type:complete len:408 (+),score=105.34 TRINITY_DN6570_c0_g1_i1:451-1674(+)
MIRTTAALLAEAVVPTVGIYRRPLPKGLISFSSEEGRDVFKQAVREGGCEGYFSLAEQFHTQDEPAYCGLGSLSMVLNALNITDRNSVVKRNVKHLTETNLDIHKPLDVVKAKGITFEEFECMAALNGATVTSKRAENSSKEEFLHDLHSVTATPDTQAFMVITFSRASLQQTGDGHFSPLAAHVPSRSLGLVLDTARFKYPPYWVDTTQLWDSMLPHDVETGRSRGWFLLSRHHSPSVTRIAQSTVPWAAAKMLVLETVPAALAAMGPDRDTPGDVVECLLEALSHDAALLQALLGRTANTVKDVVPSEDVMALADLEAQVFRTAAYHCVCEVFARRPDLAALWQSSTLAGLTVAAWPVPCGPTAQHTTLQRLHVPKDQAAPLLNEVSAIRERLLVMSGQRCSCDI